jgi:adenosylcobinamide kinase/adenosylcobinamide-phosphate guanylyltransferase
MRLAGESAVQVVFVATATASDSEMAERIARHRDDRPGHWGLVEEPVALAEVLRTNAIEGRCVIVDCLTLWLGNLMLLDDETRLANERDALLECLERSRGTVLLVSNEIGMGVVPSGELSRWFRDELGSLHQALSERCDSVALCVAGLPMWLKGGGE